MSNIDEHGNLKWGCEACGSEWYGSCFETYIECPECESECIGHY